MEGSIVGSLAENILALVVFDTTSIPILRGNLSSDLIGIKEYREIYNRSLDYFARFEQAPNEHIADLCEDLLKDEEKGQFYKKILINIFSLKDSINKDFILSRLGEFTSKQNLKLAIVKAANLLQEEKTEEAWEVFSSNKKIPFTTFEQGLKLSELDKIFHHFDSEEEIIYTGIKILDNLGVCPAYKELFLLTGRSGEGKTWFLINCVKFALLQRKKILHLTLEMPEHKIGLRYLQSLFSLSTKEAKQIIPVLKKKEDGTLLNIDYEELQDNRNLKDLTVRKRIKEKLKKIRTNDLIIKEFPENYLTFSGLEAFLENLEAFYNFIPNVLVVDYPDLMFVNPTNVRIETGHIYKQLHGLVKKRHLAGIIVSQANRVAEDVTLITRKHLSEDISKVHVVDNHLTFNRTIKEREKGLARLFVEKGRNGGDGNTILITQNYGLGQFCLDSILMTKQTQDLLASQ